MRHKACSMRFVAARLPAPTTDARCMGRVTRLAPPADYKSALRKGPAAAGAGPRERGLPSPYAKGQAHGLAGSPSWPAELFHALVGTRRRSATKCGRNAEALEKSPCHPGRCSYKIPTKTGARLPRPPCWCILSTHADPPPLSHPAGDPVPSGRRPGGGAGVGWRTGRPAARKKSSCGRIFRFPRHRIPFSIAHHRFIAAIIPVVAAVARRIASRLDGGRAVASPAGRG